MNVAIGETTRHMAVAAAIVVVFAVKWLGVRRWPGLSAKRSQPQPASPRPRLRILEVILFGVLLGIAVGYVLLTQ